jgi:thymidylate synthase (FAD)
MTTSHAPADRIRVTLISHSQEPMRSLYMAYRTCYSELTPQAVLKRIDDDRITEEQMRTFIEERLKTGHASPLEQVSFEFGISGVSRAFSQA